MRGGPIRAAALVGGLLLVGCGSGPSAPRLTALHLTPTTARPFDLLSMQVEVEDPDGDLAGGGAELSLWNEAEPEGRLFEVAIAGQTTAERGALSLTLRLPADEPAGPHQLSVAVIDASERRSAPLVAALLVVAP